MLKKFILTFQILLVTLGLIGTSLVANHGVNNVSAASNNPDSNNTANWQRAAVIYPNYTGELTNPAFYRLVDRARSTNLNHISIVIQYFQSDIYSDTIYPAPYTPTDNELTSALQYIKNQGMSSSIKIFTDVDYSNETIWRAYIQPNNRQGWFNSYRNIVNKYGKIAENNNVSLFSVGTEMIELSRDDRSSLNTPNWRKVISELRTVYSGKITYGVNAYRENDDVTGVKFLNDLDVIGISAYYVLSANPNATVSDLVASWSYIEQSNIQPLIDTYQKPIMFTELGYRSVSTSLASPWESGGNINVYNEQTQARAYESLIRFFQDKSYFLGWHIWNMDTNIPAQNSGDTSFSPLNKLAEKVLQNLYPVLPPVSSNTDPIPSSASISSATTTSPVSSSSSSPSIILTPTPVFSSALTSTGVAITNNTGNRYNELIVSFELFDDMNQKVEQVFLEKQTFIANQTLNFNPNFKSKNGIYKLKVGVFSADWKSLLAWNDNFGSFEVKNLVASSSSIPQSSSSISSSNSSRPNSSSSSISSISIVKPSSSSRSTPKSSSAFSSSKPSNPRNNKNWLQNLLAQITFGNATAKK